MNTTASIKSFTNGYSRTTNADSEMLLLKNSTITFIYVRITSCFKF